MKKRIAVVIMVLMLWGSGQKAMAWGKTGHELVAQIALHFLDDSTKALVQKYLGNLSFEEAANWMDDSRSNSYYNYMRTWHYINLDKGQDYAGSAERNSLTVLHSAIAELRQYKTIKSKDVKRDLLLIFHLVGDLHQPMHNGYGEDRGGNSVNITSPFVSGNLHAVWDTDILTYKKITLDSCLELYTTIDSNTVKSWQRINEVRWMKESRSYLDFAYSFKDNFLDKDYIDQSAVIIKRQLLIGGIRLAAILKEAFGTHPA